MLWDDITSWVIKEMQKGVSYSNGKKLASRIYLKIWKSDKSKHLNLEHSDDWV